MFKLNRQSALRTLCPETGSPLIVDEGDSVWVHPLNAGDIFQPIYTHNHRFQRVGKDSSRVPETVRYETDVTNVALAE